MDEFRTIVNVSPEKEPINFDDATFFIGSCFAESMCQKLNALKFKTCVNPYGILFNPFSIFEALQEIIMLKTYRVEDFELYNEIYSSFSLHSDMSDVDVNSAVSRINNNIQDAHRQLKNAKVLFITLGTAKVYYHSKRKKAVANCHKYPSSTFTEEIASPKQIISTFEKLAAALVVFNPGLKVCLTVSPVRHWRDGAVENQISKSALLMSVRQICKLYTNCSYFPAFEIMLDDLRDYRFYEEDLIHPNSQALKYIWSKFKLSWIDGSCEEVVSRIEKLNNAVAHRVFHPETDAYRVFVNKVLAQICSLEKDFPALDFSAEKAHFNV